MASGKKQNLIEGALVLTVAVVVVKIIGAIYKMPMVAIIGEDGMGFYQTAYNLYGTIYAVAVSGFPVAVSKIVAGYATENRYKDVRRVISVSTTFFALLGIVGSVLLILMAKPYADLSKNPRAVMCIIAVAPSLLFSCLMSTYRGYNQGMKNMTPTAVSQIVEVVFKAASGLICAYLIRSAFTSEYLSAGTVWGAVMRSDGEAQVTIMSYAAAGCMVGVTVSTAAGWVYLAFKHFWDGDGIRKAQINASPAPHARKYLLKQIVMIGFPIALSAIAVSLTGFIDNIMILNVLSSVLRTDIAAVYASHGGVLELAEKAVEDLPNYLYGVYGLGITIFNLVPSITGSFGMSALPHVTAAWTMHDIPTVKKNVESVLRVTTMFAAPAGFGIAFLAGPIAKLIYSSRPVGAQLVAPILSVLGIAAIFVAIVGPVSALLQAVGRVDVPVKLMVVGGIIKIAANYFLVSIPTLNIKAAPAGNLMCYFTIAFFSIVILRKTIGTGINVSRTILKPMFAGLLTGVFALLSYNGLSMLLHPGKMVTVLAICVGVGVYCAAVLLLRVIEREDIESLPGGKKIERTLEKLRVLR